jgi:hypothetical protein
MSQRHERRITRGMAEDHRCAAIVLMLIGAAAVACRNVRETLDDRSRVGGGPPPELPQLYSTTSALEVLREARCERVRSCGIVGADCERDAEAVYGPVIMRCERGVRESALLRCADHVRTTPCSSMVAIAHRCTAGVLCSDF